MFTFADDQPRILLLDIETINLKADLSPILCIAFKHLTDPTIHSLSIWQPDLVHPGDFEYADRNLCRVLLPHLLDADYLVAHYGCRFDRKFINSRLLVNHLTPIPPTLRLIDTWRLAKDNTLFSSNRLGNLNKVLKLDHQKSDSGGWSTWLNALTGNDLARRNLVRYCRNDVLALQDLYLALRPFDTHVNHNLFAPDRSNNHCPTCGSTSFASRGWTHTKTTTYRRFRCRRCNRVFRLDKHNRNPR